MDWMPLGPPPGFIDALGALQSPEAWSDVRERLFGMWRARVDEPRVHSYVDSMATYGFEMWSRAGREIAKSFTEDVTPLAALAGLAEQQGTPCPTLHVYAQPHDDAYLAAQQDVAADLGWFHVHRLAATSHFPCLEVPDETVTVIDQFIGGLG
jgi:pimeloyl-ACP methyl ester carboxylesterase